MSRAPRRALLLSIVLLPVGDLLSAPGSRSVFAMPHFEPAPGHVEAFVARFEDRTVVVRPGALRLQWIEPGAASDAAAMVRVDLEFGAAHERSLVGEEPLPGRSHYYLGNDPSAWREDVPHFRAVRSIGVAEGVDAVFRIVDGRLVYELITDSAARIERIGITIRGATSSAIDDDSGELLLCAGRSTPQTIRIAAPASFQGAGTNWVPVPSR